MPTYTNLDCILDLVDIQDSCIDDQSGVQFFLDDLGLSLSTASDVADERYVTGRNLVDQKKRIALDEIYDSLTRNVNPDCDLDKADGILCDRKERIARVLWYKVAALIYKERVVDSQAYNEQIQFAGSEAIAQMLYYDSSYRIFTDAESIPAGKFQREMEKLENIRQYIEKTCCSECQDSHWQITLP